MPQLSEFSWFTQIFKVFMIFFIILNMLFFTRAHSIYSAINIKTFVFKLIL